MGNKNGRNGGSKEQSEISYFTMGNVKELLSMSRLFEELAENKDRVVVIEFYYSFCSICLDIAPAVKKAAGLFPHVVFMRAEVTDLEGSLKHFELDGVPTFISFFGQAEIDRYEGNDKRKLHDFIRRSELKGREIIKTREANKVDEDEKTTMQSLKEDLCHCQ